MFALESDSFLSKQATQNFLDHGADNVFLIEGPLNMDGVEHGPFDVILLGGSVEVIPTALISQLSEGGRLLTVMHQKTGSGKAILFEKHHGSISERQLFDANVRPLPGVFEEQVKFKF